MQDSLYDDPRLARFYDLTNGWDADCDYCAALAQGADSVLDLGCGTGRLAAALADRRRVIGVDPAAAMLAIARRRSGGAGVTWIEGDARTLRLDARFDLVMLTGHAFQVFLTPDDQHAVLTTIARHLSADGRFVFDTRNPARRAWRRWTPALTRRCLDDPALGPVDVWTDASFDPPTGIVAYTTRYRVARTDDVFQAVSRIRFTAKDDLARQISAAGLAVDRWLGDWTGAAWTDRSPEIIALGRLR